MTLHLPPSLGCPPGSPPPHMSDAQVTGVTWASDTLLGRGALLVGVVVAPGAVRADDDRHAHVAERLVSTLRVGLFLRDQAGRHDLVPGRVVVPELVARDAWPPDITGIA